MRPLSRVITVHGRWHRCWAIIVIHWPNVIIQTQTTQKGIFHCARTYIFDHTFACLIHIAYGNGRKWNVCYRCGHSIVGNYNRWCIPFFVNVRYEIERQANDQQKWQKEERSKRMWKKNPVFSPSCLPQSNELNYRSKIEIFVSPTYRSPCSVEFSRYWWKFSLQLVSSTIAWYRLLAAICSLSNSSTGFPDNLLGRTIFTLLPAIIFACGWYKDSACLKLN